eukprot:CAMPEP_0198724368 /NCGR_PEP_ID=MMETSP1475-20131203/1851_1 /TAXON_ID= ORGANISM="Unidentified sp., Strain CCMP1999" /NCGR_SAMPLE_ID=MMETSP1475 /ASSEMBLY_ACC=CAM_ASM_001111 /LENGTH=605 /DNA_ID=CAMNT_0044485875 /DNA_START=33 /DNA_END=1850 /DNA_ORIENTATION=+
MRRGFFGRGRRGDEPQDEVDHDGSAPEADVNVNVYGEAEEGAGAAEAEARNGEEGGTDEPVDAVEKDFRGRFKFGLPKFGRRGSRGGNKKGADEDGEEPSGEDENVSGEVDYMEEVYGTKRAEDAPVNDAPDGSEAAAAYNRTGSQRSAQRVATQPPAEDIYQSPAPVQASLRQPITIIVTAEEVAKAAYGHSGSAVTTGVPSQPAVSGPGSYQPPVSYGPAGYGAPNLGGNPYMDMYSPSEASASTPMSTAPSMPSTSLGQYLARGKELCAAGLKEDENKHHQRAYDLYKEASQSLLSALETMKRDYSADSVATEKADAEKHLMMMLNRCETLLRQGYAIKKPPAPPQSAPSAPPPAPGAGHQGVSPPAPTDSSAPYFGAQTPSTESVPNFDENSKFPSVPKVHIGKYGGNEAAGTAPSAGKKNDGSEIPKPFDFNLADFDQPSVPDMHARYPAAHSPEVPHHSPDVNTRPYAAPDVNTKPHAAPNVNTKPYGAPDVNTRPYAAADVDPARDHFSGHGRPESGARETATSDAGEREFAEDESGTVRWKPGMSCGMCGSERVTTIIPCGHTFCERHMTRIFSTFGGKCSVCDRRALQPEARNIAF